ncbi:hypothetical protein P4N68_08805 [Corynebacterium felinum]|uniref:Uncharacterized protein n=1 Tax=Corynebacterium felinum TaxID=131318 RepID=A0ABU2B7Y7_9CORY|nr:hypothetical protein [Corynebacterium felinum]MDF5821175.1 hypothetical protein [Corynebacterium felinum]MDR7354501.1 hypothetical protein [Corynebacterium felinum]
MSPKLTVLWLSQKIFRAVALLASMLCAPQLVAGQLMLVSTSSRVLRMRGVIVCDVY